MWRRLIPLVILTATCGIATAANIHPLIEGTASFRGIVIEGEIEPGDFDKFLTILRDNQAMRALELSSLVPMRSESGNPVCDGIDFLPKPKDPKNCTCASACFFIHIGSVYRSGTYLAVHRPYFVKGKFGDLSESEAKKAFDTLQGDARSYMAEMGVPKHIQEDVLGTPSERALLLDDKTVKTYFWQELPYLHEWRKNKCSVLSATETERFAFLNHKLATSPGAASDSLSKEEWSELGPLQKKNKEETDCQIATGKEGRIRAYEKYFGVKPNDFSVQNFTKWSEPTRYLGRSFDDILTEEVFKEEAIGKSAFLSRAATSKSPYLSLSNVYGKERVVGTVDVLNTPNPSAEFTK